MQRSVLLDFVIDENDDDAHRNVIFMVFYINSIQFPLQNPLLACLHFSFPGFSFASSVRGYGCVGKIKKCLELVLF